MDVKFSTQTKVADASREYQMNKAAFDQEVNTKKAEAELAYELQVSQHITHSQALKFCSEGNSSCLKTQLPG